MVIESTFVAVSCVRGLELVFLSRTSTVNVKVPAARWLGMPEMSPVCRLILSPDGSIAEPVASFQMYVGFPPPAVSVAVYRCPMLPLGNDVVEMVNGVAAAAITGNMGLA